MPPDPETLSPEVEKEFLSILDGLEEAREERLAKMCQAHPKLAREIRARFAAALPDGTGGGGGEDGEDDGAGGNGEWIGPYRILDRLGEGGMGTVYLAERRAPVKMRVALKLIKLGMDSKAVLRRFEAERQALAMMEHSAIARVYDAGITAEGQPYFAMEYVKGVPITEYCDASRLTLEERITLFEKVCSGVQHAHLKGVIHRDIKPSNVLVTLQDGKPMPKIIDFGLAKATAQYLQVTVYTERGQILGTPEYMSPEQAGLGGLDIDTRTDVYSLGILLYQLLVGELPFSAEELRRAGYLEMQRIVREQEPLKPSTRITTIGAAAAEHAARRRLDPPDLRRKLCGDLDWIVLKAIEKDRTRRYETALELAADLQRHLRFEPVLASPPTLGYRVRKFARRYRAQCVAAGLVLAALLAGSIGTAVGFARARAAAREADASAARAEAALVDFHQLAAVVRLEEAKERLAQLPPPQPSAAGAIEDWLRECGAPLTALLPQLERRLAGMEQTASRADPAQVFLAGVLTTLGGPPARLRHHGRAGRLCHLASSHGRSTVRAHADAGRLAPESGLVLVLVPRYESGGATVSRGS